VVEGGAVGVDPIVAIEADRAEGHLVLDHPRQIDYLVAGEAGRRRERLQGVGVTVLADEDPACVVCRMRSQQVSRPLVRVSIQVGARQRRHHPQVVGVAVAAIGRGRKTAVKPVHGFDLLRHLGMTGQAAVAHSIAGPDGRVARGAAGLQFGVGDDPTEGTFPAIPAELTRAEDPVSGGSRRAEDRHRRQDGGDQRRSGQTAQGTIHIAAFPSAQQRGVVQGRPNVDEGHDE